MDAVGAGAGAGAGVAIDVDEERVVTPRALSTKAA